MDGAISVILNINIDRPPHNLVLNQRFWSDLACRLSPFINAEVACLTHIFPSSGKEEGRNNKITKTGNYWNFKKSVYFWEIRCRLYSHWTARSPCCGSRRLRSSTVRTHRTLCWTSPSTAWILFSPTSSPRTASNMCLSSGKMTRSISR